MVRRLFSFGAVSRRLHSGVIMGLSSTSYPCKCVRLSEVQIQLLVWYRVTLLEQGRQLCLRCYTRPHCCDPALVALSQCTHHDARWKDARRSINSAADTSFGLVKFSRTRATACFRRPYFETLLKAPTQPLHLS